MSEKYPENWFLTKPFVLAAVLLAGIVALGLAPLASGQAAAARWPHRWDPALPGRRFLIATPYNNALDGLKIFQDDPLVAPPGTKFSYSSYGFNLLSAAIQNASGQESLAYVHEHVLGPLGLRSTGLKKVAGDRRAERK